MPDQATIDARRGGERNAAISKAVARSFTDRSERGPTQARTSVRATRLAELGLDADAIALVADEQVDFARADQLRAFKQGYENGYCAALAALREFWFAEADD